MTAFVSKHWSLKVSQAGTLGRRGLGMLVLICVAHRQSHPTPPHLCCAGQSGEREGRQEGIHHSIAADVVVVLPHPNPPQLTPSHLTWQCPSSPRIILPFLQARV